MNRKLDKMQHEWLEEATIRQMQERMATGDLTSEEIDRHVHENDLGKKSEYQCHT